MTYLEALRKVLFSTDVERVMYNYCPADVGNGNCPAKSCQDCWNREMPKEEDHDNV